MSDNAVTLGGSGIFRLTGGTQNINGTPGHVLTNGAGHTIEGFSTASLGSHNINLINEGTISANVSGKTLTIDPRATFTNSGTLRAEPGATLSLAAGTYTNSGTLRAEPGATLSLAAGTYTNSGLIEVLATGLLDFAPTAFPKFALHQTSGELRVNGTLQNSSLNIVGGIVSGTGTIDVGSGFSNFGPGATLKPGDSTGTGIGTLTLSSTRGGPLSAASYLARPTIEIDLASDSVHDVVNLGHSGYGAANLRINLTGPVSGFTGKSISIVTRGWSALIPPDRPTPNVIIEPVGGVFLTNIAFGERLTTVDGKLSFIVRGTGPLVSPLTRRVLVTEITLESPLPTANVPTNAGQVNDLLTGPGGAFEGQTDAAVTGFDADPDGDGHGNVFELWLGTDPAKANPTPISPIKPILVGADVFAAMDVTVDAAVDDLLSVHGFLSEDLDNFSIGQCLNLGEVGTQRNLRFLSSLPITGAKAFGRLQADPSAIRP